MRRFQGSPPRLHPALELVFSVVWQLHVEHQHGTTLRAFVVSTGKLLKVRHVGRETLDPRYRGSPVKEGVSSRL